jgi:hypothetical protein
MEEARTGASALTGRGLGGVGTTLLLAAAAGLASLAICQYRFGTFDHGQYLVQVISLQEPAALGDDPYAAVFASLRSVFWVAFAAVTPEASWAVASLVLCFAIASVNAVLLLAIGRRLLAGGRSGPGARSVPLLAAAAPMLVLVVPKELNWFGLVSLGDVELSATLAVMPLLLVVMLLWLAGRPLAALVAAAVAVPVHGQTAAYLLAAWWVAFAWSGRRCAISAAIALGVGVVGLLAVLVERAAGAVPPEELDALRQVGADVYPELINPLLAPPLAWGAVAAILALGVAAAKPWHPGGRTEVERRLLVWSAATLVFPAVGLGLLAAGAEEPLLWRLMVGRALMLSQIAALVLFASWSARAMGAGGGRGVLAAACLLLVAWWPFPDLHPVAAAGGLGAVIVIVAAVRPDAAGRDAAQPAWGRRIGLGASVAGLALVVLAAARVRDRPFPWLESGADDAWREAQAWAREHTPPGTYFLTPPYIAGWRVGSHRPTFGELKDGALLFYTGRPAVEWSARMGRLGVHAAAPWLELEGAYGAFGAPPTEAEMTPSRDAYAAALSGSLPAVLATRPVEYVVTEAGRDVAVGERVWSNEGFVIRRVDPAALGSAHTIR